MKHHFPALTAGFLGLMLACSSAQATINFKADDQGAVLNGNELPASANKVYGKGVLKAAEVKACVALAAKTNALSAEVQRQQKSVHATVSSGNEEAAAISKLNSSLEAERASLVARGKAIEAEQAAGGDKDAIKAKIDALNQDKAANNAQFKALEERAAKAKAASDTGGSVDVAGYNDKVARMNKQLDEFDDKCADKDYYADDYAAAKAALKP